MTTNRLFLAGMAVLTTGYIAVALWALWWADRHDSWVFAIDYPLTLVAAVLTEWLWLRYCARRGNGPWE